MTIAGTAWNAAHSWSAGRASIPCAVWWMPRCNGSRLLEALIAGRLSAMEISARTVRCRRPTRLWTGVMKALQEQARRQPDVRPNPQATRTRHRRRRRKQRPRGYDAGKKIKDCKRRVAAETQGLLLAVIVHSAGSRARKPRARCCSGCACDSLLCARSLWTGGIAASGLILAKAMSGLDGRGGQVHRTASVAVLSKRWIVGRTFTCDGLDACSKTMNCAQAHRR